MLCGEKVEESLFMCWIVLFTMKVWEIVMGGVMICDNRVLL